MTNDDGYPVDPWLRSLTKNGMHPIAVDHRAMYLHISEHEFENIKQLFWRQFSTGANNVWWCNETGFFYPQVDGSYIYAESNLWGSLYANK